MAKRGSKKQASRSPTAEDRIVLLTGKERFLREHYTSDLRGALEQAHGGLDVFRFSGAEASAGEVLDECRSFGLMSGHKLVILDEAEQVIKAETRPLFERYAEAPSEGATLIIRSDSWKRGNLDKLIEQVGLAIKCEELGDAMAVRWVGRRCEHAHGRAIDADAAAQLVQRLGTDLSKLDGELAKLAAGTEAGGSIGRAAVVELVGESREEKFWSVQEALLSGNPEYALQQLRRVLGQSPRDAAVPTTYFVVDLARKLHGAAVGQAGGESPRALMSRLKLWGESGNAILASAKRMGPRRTADLLDRCVRVDQAGKSGLGKPERNLERLALEVCGAVGRR